jgi:2-C-methyl-D-erythritol 4-phosphate cytidylyltransferase
VSEAAPEIRVGVVIPAAGAGVRLGGHPKQFRLLGGKPLLVQTAQIFEAHPEVSCMVIVAATSDMDQVRGLCQKFDLQKVVDVVEGGDSRQVSVRNGISALPDDIDIILTHDAVRPFVTPDEVSRLIVEVVKSGAAAMAAPVNDTLVRARQGSAGESVSRDQLYRMLTPQGFRRTVLQKAHQMAEDTDSLFTDEVTLVRATGQSVVLVEGSPLNIKVTTREDWELTQWMWSAWQNK